MVTLWDGAAMVGEVGYEGSIFLIKTVYEDSHMPKM